MGVTKSYKRDVQILMKILSNQKLRIDLSFVWKMQENNML